MNKNKDELYMCLNEEGFIRKSVVLILCIFIGYLFFEYLIPFSIPFLSAYLISKLVRPFSLKMRKICPGLDKPVTIIALVVITGIICVCVRLIASFVVSQIGDLLKIVTERFDSGETPLSVITEKIVHLVEKHPTLKRLMIDGFEAGQIENAVTGMITKILEETGSFFAKLTRSFVAGFPSIILSFFVTLSAALYISLDRGETSSFLSGFLSEDMIRDIKDKRAGVSKAVWGYFKTYLLMMLIVFSILYFGLSILGIDHALIKAILVAVVDLLPILGVGTVLVPWSLVCFITGNVSLGIALLIMLAVVTLAREFLEPKIVGKYTGVPPVIALVSVYIGTKLCGVKGLILFPILTSVFFAVIRDTRHKKTPTEVEVQ